MKLKSSKNQTLAIGSDSLAVICIYVCLFFVVVVFLFFFSMILLG